MNNDVYYSFDENALPHASMNSFESQPDNQSFTAEQAPANETFTDGGMNGFAPASNYAYAFNESTLPQPTVNHLWQPMSSTHQEMLEGQYAFNQFGLPQATTNVFEFDFPINTQFDANDINNPTWGSSTTIDHQALDQTLTDLSTPDWASAGSGLNALSSNTTAGTSFTGSVADAPFEVDESDDYFLSASSNVRSYVRIGRSSNSFCYDRKPMSESLTCSWPNCNKRHPFKTQQLLQTHLDNIHLNPLHCTQQGCSYNRPFPKKGDLDRHLATVHGIGRLFRCPRRECPRHARPFGRKDKLREHVNTSKHGLQHCQYDHCKFTSVGGLLTREDVSKHEMDDWEHGDYECAIGNCAGSISRFSDFRWAHHISQNHNITYMESAFELLKPGSKTLTLADVSNLGDEWYRHTPKALKTTCAECEKGGRSNAGSSL